MVGAGGRGTPLPYVVDLSSCVNVGLRRASAAAGTANNNIIGALQTPHPPQAVPLPLKGKANPLFYVLRSLVFAVLVATLRRLEGKPPYRCRLLLQYKSGAALQLRYTL